MKYKWWFESDYNLSNFDSSNDLADLNDRARGCNLINNITRCMS